MVEYSLRSPVVEPEKLMEAATDLAGAHRELSAEDIEELIDRGETYTESILQIGMELGIIEKSDNDYVINRDVRMQLRQSSSEQKIRLLRSRLQQYKPFIAFVSSLIQGSSPDRAAKQVKVLYQMDITAEDLNTQLLKLGKYVEIFDEAGDDDGISFEINTDVVTDEYIHNLSTAVKSSLVARLFLEKRLNEEIIGYMDEETVDELVNAVEIFWDRPRSAIAAAGRAIEDFQRDLGNDYGQNPQRYQNANGISELADQLKGEGLVLSRHVHGGKYLGGMRNPSGGHGKDPQTLDRWDVSEEVAFGYILASIHYVRSLYAYVVQDRQVL